MTATTRFIDFSVHDGSVFLRFLSLEIFAGRQDGIGRYLLVRLRRRAPLAAPGNAGLVATGSR